MVHCGSLWAFNIQCHLLASIADTSQQPHRAGSPSHPSHREMRFTEKDLPNTSPFLLHIANHPLTNSKRWSQELCGSTSVPLKFCECARSCCATSSRKSLTANTTSTPDKQLPSSNNSVWNMDRERHESLPLVNRVYLHEHISLCIWWVLLWSNKRALKPFIQRTW